MRVDAVCMGERDIPILLREDAVDKLDVLKGDPVVSDRTVIRQWALQESIHGLIVRVRNTIFEKILKAVPRS